MDNSVLDKYKLNFDDEMKKNIIESVVRVYGEEYRGVLCERINNFTLVQYITPEHLKIELNDRINNKNHELTIKFFKEKGFNVESDTELTEEMKKITYLYFDSRDYRYSPYNCVYSFNNEKNDERTLKDRVRFLEKMGIDGVTIENYGEYAMSPDGMATIEEIKRTLSIISSLDNEFCEYKGQFAEEERYLEECNMLNNRLSNEATRGYYEEIKEYLTEDERNEVERIFNRTQEDKYRYAFFGRLGKFFSYNIGKSSPIEAFSEDYDSYDKQDKMVEYFKACGLNLGFDYSSYENSEDAKKLIPPVEVVKKVKAIREKYGKDTELKYFRNTGTIGDNLEQIHSLGLLDTVEFSRDFVESNIICIQPNAIYGNDGEVKNFNLLFYPPLAVNKNYKNIFFIHEVLHCLESSIKQVNGKYIFCTGFEKNQVDISQKEDIVDIDKEVDNSIRKYALFSENMHQNLAIEVTEDLISRGVSILDNDEEQKIRGGASYEKFNWVTHIFYDKFKKAIIEARMSGDTDKLKSIVGERNFERLNELVNEYESLPYFQMMSAVVNGKENDLTKRRNEIRTEADLIVSNMERESRSCGIDR